MCEDQGEKKRQTGRAAIGCEQVGKPRELLNGVDALNRKGKRKGELDE